MECAAMVAARVSSGVCLLVMLVVLLGTALRCLSGQCADGIWAVLA
jgi:hypothetical protein